MGGHAFTSAPHSLHVPRLPTRLYRHLVTHFHALLRGRYEKIATPIPGPGKTDHGDIDILVSGPRGANTTDGEQMLGGRMETEDVGALLGAVAWIEGGGEGGREGGEGWMFAVPLSTEDARAFDSEDPGPPHVQLDITLTTPLLFQWSLHHHSHSDLWNLLGTTIRPFGLTATEKGLHVRIAEIEAFNRKKSLVLLTIDPGQVLRFLGYGASDHGEEVEAVLNREFSSVEEMYGFVARGRFFRREVYVDWTSSAGRGRSKANDRRRMKQRDVYRGFVEEWVPNLPEPCPSSGGEGVENGVKGGDRELTREMVVDEALEVFGRRVEYESRLKEWKRERRELEIRQARREERKRAAGSVEIYVGAWVGWLRGNEEAAAASAAAGIAGIGEGG